jgi:hypothetical protein
VRWHQLQLFLFAILCPSAVACIARLHKAPCLPRNMSPRSFVICPREPSSEVFWKWRLVKLPADPTIRQCLHAVGGEQRAPVRSACGRLLADQPMLIPARLPSCLTTASCGTRHMPLPCPTLHVQVAFFQPPHPAINTIAAGRCSMPNPRARYT